MWRQPKIKAYTIPIIILKPKRDKHRTLWAIIADYKLDAILTISGLSGYGVDFKVAQNNLQETTTKKFRLEHPKGKIIPPYQSTIEVTSFKQTFKN